MSCEHEIDVAVAAVGVERELDGGDTGGCGGCLTLLGVLLLGTLAAGLLTGF